MSRIVTINCGGEGKGKGRKIRAVRDATWDELVAGIGPTFNPTSSGRQTGAIAKSRATPSLDRPAYLSSTFVHIPPSVIPLPSHLGHILKIQDLKIS
jgi:hypothetical protein